MKYMSTFEELIHFLMFFDAIEPKPSFLFIDDLEYFLDIEDNKQKKHSRLAHIFAMLSEVKKLLPKPVKGLIH